MKYYKVKTIYIDYCVEAEDLYETFEEQHPEVEVDSDEYFEAIDVEITRLKKELPQDLVLEIECDPEDLDDMVADAVSEETGWLIDWVDYDILKEKKIEE